MGRKAGLTRDDVVDAAVVLADEVGLENLTLAALAARLEIRPPSLYNHIDGTGGLRRELALRGARAIIATAEPAHADAAGEDALRATCRAFRRFALEHPGLYSATTDVENLVDDHEVWGELSVVIGELAEMLGEMGIPETVHITVVRALRSTLHGFVTLERNRGFGEFEDIEVSFDLMIDLILAGLRAEGPRLEG